MAARNGGGRAFPSKRAQRPDRRVSNTHTLLPAPSQQAFDNRGDFQPRCASYPNRRPRPHYLPRHQTSRRSRSAPIRTTTTIPWRLFGGQPSPSRYTTAGATPTSGPRSALEATSQSDQSGFRPRHGNGRLIPSDQVIAANSGLGGNPQIAAAATALYAYAFTNAATTDSAVLITLPPCGYTAQASSVTGTAGTALVAMYEVP